MDTELHLEQDDVTLSDSFPTNNFSQPLLQLLPEQQKNLELLSHLASYSELLIVVSGPTGIGKSTLAQALAAQREEPEDTLMLQADLMMGLPAILQSIATSWDMPQLSGDLAEAKQAVSELAVQRYQQGVSSLVIIDQAEQLDIDTLNDLAHLALLAPQSLSFALFGCSGFESNIKESPTQAPVHNLRLQPMAEDAAQQLAVQVFGADAFADDQLKFAYQQAQGLPLIFMRELEDILLSATPQVSANAVINRFPLTHILATAAIAAVLGVAFLYQSSESELSPEQQLLAELEQPVVEVSSEEPVAELVFSDEQVSDLNTPEVATVTEEVEPQETDFNYQPSEDAHIEVVSESVVESQDPVAGEAVKQLETVTETKPAVAAVVYSADEIALRDAKGYVTQLLGSHNKESAKAFIVRWQPQVANQLYLYQGLHNGKEWYVVVAGVYADRTAAKQALAGFPAQLRKQSPWIKDVKSVQKVLASRK